MTKPTPVHAKPPQPIRRKTMARKVLKAAGVAGLVSAAIIIVAVRLESQKNQATVESDYPLFI